MLKNILCFCYFYALNIIFQLNNKPSTSFTLSEIFKFYFLNCIVFVEYLYLYLYLYYILSKYTVFVLKFCIVYLYAIVSRWTWSVFIHSIRAETPYASAHAGVFFHLRASLPRVSTSQGKLIQRGRTSAARALAGLSTNTMYKHVFSSSF